MASTRNKGTRAPPGGKAAPLDDAEKRALAARVAALVDDYARFGRARVAVASALSSLLYARDELAASGALSGDAERLLAKVDAACDAIDRDETRKVIFEALDAGEELSDRDFLACIGGGARATLADVARVRQAWERTKPGARPSGAGALRSKYTELAAFVRRVTGRTMTPKSAKTAYAEWKKGRNR